MKLFSSRIQRNAQSLAFALLLMSFPAFAGTTVPKKPAAPAKPAAAAPKPAARPAGGATGGSPGAATHTGPTTGGTHTGPTTSSPHTGPSTTSPHTGSTGAGTGAGAGHAGNVPQKTPSTRPVTATGRPAPKGSQTVATKNGAVTKRPNGKISDVHDTKRGVDVHNGLNGGRRVSVTRPDGSRVVAERGRPGYIQRGYTYHGHEYARRSYYWHGHEYNWYYRGYYYGNVYVNVYAPGYYYGAGFYGWAYNPWYAPISFSWGWGGNPWYGYYGGYFAPYPVYPGPAFWLTDYIISTELAAAYTAQQEAQTTPAAPAASSAPALTPEIKAEIAEEVKAQIALENAEAQQNAQGQAPDPASSGIGRLLTDGKTHVFVANTALDVVDAGGTECALSDGDALQLSAPPPADSTTVDLVVLASKGSKECAPAATVTVAVADLQEMQNHMRETIDQGLQELQAKQGTGGLPAAPPSATAPPVETAMAQAAPPPEANGAADVNAQVQVADQVDAEAAQAAPSPIGAVDSQVSQPAAAPAPVSIAVGQSIDEVTAALGSPLSVIDLGTKKVYKYKDMKITFRAGKVSSVE